VCCSQYFYVDVNLSLKMTENLKIFGVFKNIFMAGGLLYLTFIACLALSGVKSILLMWV